MAKPRLTKEMRLTLLEWVAADYDTRLILQWFRERGWPDISRQSVQYYRKRYGEHIEELRQTRRDSALNTGLALREERVARLKKHADKLEAIKWVPDKNGRLWNEKAWREVLDEIAKEVGERKTTTEAELTGQLQVRVVYEDERSNDSSTTTP